MDGGAWWAAVHGVAKSRTRLSNFTFTFCFHALEKEMATHSSVLAWRIPGTGKPGGLPSMGSHRVGHDWRDLAAAAAAATRCCMAKTNTTLWSNYLPIKSKLFQMWRNKVIQFSWLLGRGEFLSRSLDLVLCYKLYKPQSSRLTANFHLFTSWNQFLDKLPEYIFKHMYLLL